MAQGGYTTRKAAFKQIDSAIGNLETSMYHLNIVKNEYTTDHPEIAGAAHEIMKGILYWQQVLEKFRHAF